ncbi:hypothetical protein [Microbulbifer pacificus]|uniref:Uncharacterized protein n=1 Tax=Microbulbifer pacificus TaxID=407164 RepID=A0AAU0N0Q5_9GAMM|nr:hypothetical protein [Microbulbifer pacificus]WOX05867.1 hypothetical protein R5R33_01580 [Microbulbifer pacificus]
MHVYDPLKAQIRWLQLHLNPAVPLSPSQIQVHVYRDQVDTAALDRLNACFQQQLPLPAHTPESYTAFILCKPFLAEDRLDVHALECLGDDGKPNGELWVKLKSGAALAVAFGVPGGEQELPLQALQQYLLGEITLPGLEARTLQDGPSWLCTALETSGDAWQLPVLETPLDVPERFAGHCYMKLVTKHHPACRKPTLATEENNQ